MIINSISLHIYEKTYIYIKLVYGLRLFFVSLTMTYEPGSLQCRSLIDAKENLINVMKSLNGIENLEHVQTNLKEIYNELEKLHDTRREKELR